MNKPLQIKGTDHRATMYKKIADVHSQVVEAKWRARTTNTQMSLKPAIVVHLEETVAFLAEELLKVTAIVQGIPEKLEETKRMLEEDR